MSDGFGIEYKPSNPRNLDDSFDEDSEILKLPTIRNVIDDDDDEFDVLNASESNEFTKSAINKALESASLRPREIETVSGLDDGDTSSSSVANNIYFENVFSNSVVLPNTGIVKSSDLQEIILISNDNNANKVNNYLNDARKSYKDIVDIYGSGMGDQGIVMQEKKEEIGRNEGGKSSSVMLGVKETIEEGDEEEEERIELEKEDQNKLIDLQVNELVNQWNRIGIDNNNEVVQSKDVNSSSEYIELPMSFNSLSQWLLSHDMSPYLPLIQTEEDTSSTAAKGKGWMLSNWRNK